MRPDRTKAHQFSIAVIAALTLFAPQLSTGAEIFLEGASGSIYLKGTITKDDPARFRALAANREVKYPAVYPVVWLESDGGDVFAAIDIGRQIRAKSMAIFVFNRCVSACVFIYAGGVQRSVDLGTLGIHRPYNTDTRVASQAEADKRYKQLDAIVRAYFKEMNVADGLADDMLRIKPQDVKFLTRAEADRYGLVGDDPGFGDRVASREASHLGISKQEYYVRDRRVQSECPRGVILPEFDCADRIMRGVPIEEWQRRQKRAELECPPSSGDEKGHYENLNAYADCRNGIVHGKR